MGVSNRPAIRAPGRVYVTRLGCAYCGDAIHLLRALPCESVQAEDLSWRSWVERYGDEEALGVVAAIDELLDEMLARAKAGEGTT